MIKREFWLAEIEEAWKELSIVWLSGVRRVGKTYLCKSLDNIEFFNCDLPRVQKLLIDPEQFFLQQSPGKRIVLDEIHKLSDPSMVLKIGADEFPEIKIIATGSSTLAALKKFSDTLTGRKNNIHLTPLLLQEGKLFGNNDIKHRMLFGGLPPFFMRKRLPEKRYSEWFTSYLARDVQELYNIADPSAYIKFVKLALARSGGIFEASSYAPACEVSRGTIGRYLHIAGQTHVLRIVDPFSTRASTEIVAASKVYGFDTGFVCFSKGWELLREEYYGDLWEHIVLNNIVGMFQEAGVKYWRTKSGHEIDFIVQKNRNKEPIVVECKWTDRTFDPKNIKAFRSKYPEGKNFVVSSDIITAYDRVYNGITVSFVSLNELCRRL